MSARHRPAVTCGRPLIEGLDAMDLLAPYRLAVDTSARDGGHHKAAVIVRPVVVSRRQVLDAHGLTGEQIAHLQGLADAAERRRWQRIGDTILALLVIAALVSIALWWGPEMLLP